MHAITSFSFTITLVAA